MGEIPWIAWIGFGAVTAIVSLIVTIVKPTALYWLTLVVGIGFIAYGWYKRQSKVKKSDTLLEQKMQQSRMRQADDVEIEQKPEQHPQPNGPFGRSVSEDGPQYGTHTKIGGSPEPAHHAAAHQPAIHPTHQGNAPHTTHQGSVQHTAHQYAGSHTHSQHASAVHQIFNQQASPQNYTGQMVSREPPVQQRFCTSCGSPLAPGGRFCHGCGARV